MQIHGSVRARLVLSSRMKQLNADLKSLLASAVNISIEKVEPKYPQQNGKLVRQTVYQRQPAAIYGMEALLNVRQAVVLGQPLATKFCTLCDDTKGQKRLAEVYKKSGEGRAEAGGPAARRGRRDPGIRRPRSASRR